MYYVFQNFTKQANTELYLLRMKGTFPTSLANVCGPCTPHNHNHGYVRDIIAVDSYGKEVG